MLTDLRLACRRTLLPLAVVVLAAACAPRTPPPLPAVLTYPEFVFPAVPASLQDTRGADRVDRGWRFLQNDDLSTAEREFSSALQRSPSLYPAQAGLGYVALARNDADRALAGFDAALRADAAYVPALAGRGQALLALRRDADALAAFEAALAADASSADLRRRVEVLRFRSLQTVIDEARKAAAAGRVDEALTAYGKALEASPESAFLYRELGLVLRKRGDVQGALERFRRASELDPADAASLIQIGELLEQQRDYAAAADAYRRAADLEPGDDVARRIAAVEERARESRLPAEFRAIAGAAQVTRGDLAALIGVRLAGELRDAPTREVVITDVAGHWAAPWVAEVARAGVIEPFPNHTFQPGSGIRRADLATAASRVVALMAEDDPALRVHLTARPEFSDMPRGHLNYPAAAVAVSSGVMPLLEGGRFQVSRPVSGSEAVEVVQRLRALSDSSR